MSEVGVSVYVCVCVCVCVCMCVMPSTFLRQLLFVHGHFSFKRVTKLVLFSFYKVGEACTCE